MTVHESDCIPGAFINLVRLFIHRSDGPQTEKSSVMVISWESVVTSSLYIDGYQIMSLACNVKKASLSDAKGTMPQFTLQVELLLEAELLAVE